MKLGKDTRDALKTLGGTLPDHSNIEICVLNGRGGRECHKFRVIEGIVHHSESHSDSFISLGKGPL